MPIVRTFQCGECFHRLEITLSADQWDDPPPDCPACAQREMNQEFKPVAIGGSPRARAVAIASKIAEEDYGVADMNPQGKEGHTPNARYKDRTATHMPSGWGQAAGITIGGDMLATAMANGRQLRQQHGDGLDVLKAALKSGAQPDLIENSKRHMARIYAK